LANVDQLPKFFRGRIPENILCRCITKILHLTWSMFLHYAGSRVAVN